MGQHTITVSKLYYLCQTFVDAFNMTFLTNSADFLKHFNIQNCFLDFYFCIYVRTHAEIMKKHLGYSFEDKNF